MRVPRFRWTLRGMLFGLMPTIAIFGLWIHQSRQSRMFMQAGDAIHLMARRGADRFPAAGVKEISFTKGNITDADLDAFIPAFNGRAPFRFEVRVMRLHGSPVSPEAIKRFRAAAPECELIP